MTELWVNGEKTMVDMKPAEVVEALFERYGDLVVTINGSSRDGVPSCQPSSKMDKWLDGEIARIKPLLKKTDRVRWLWGYYDALVDMKKQIAKGGKK